MSPARILDILLLLILVSCVDSSNSHNLNGVSTLSVRILDSTIQTPGISSFEVEIQKIQISYDGEFETVFEGPIIYDLYGDKGDPIIEVAFVPIREGVVNQVRVFMGQAQAIGENGDVFDFTIPSGDASGAKAPVAPAMNVIPGGVEYEIDIDFELANNLTPQGGGFLLTPVFKASNRAYRKHIYGRLIGDACSPGLDDDHFLSGQILELRKNGNLKQRVGSYEEGKFLLVDLKPGEYALHASAPFYKESVMDVRVMGADTQITMRLAGKCSSISGTVRDLNGVPVPDASIALMDADGDLVEEVLSLIDGSFRTSRHFEADYLLAVEALHYEPFVQELYDEDIYAPVHVVLEEEL